MKGLRGKRQKKEGLDYDDYRNKESKRIKGWNEFVIDFRKQREESK